MFSYRLYGKLKVKDIDKCFNAICLSASKILKINEPLVFDVNIVNTKAIHQINKQYRMVDRPTDVITFANRDNNQINVSLLGEIFICLEIAKKQAKEYKHSLQRELIFLFTHGLLHLMGYDHISKSDQQLMFDLSNKIIKKAGLKSEYIIR